MSGIAGGRAGRARDRAHAIWKQASTICRAEDADLLIVLGGPIGVYEVERYPFLKQEFAAIEAGAQARHPDHRHLPRRAGHRRASLGSRVYPGREKEIGWGLISLSQ